MEVILTHEHADFDALASLVGLARLKPGAIAVLPQTVNTNVAEFLTLYGGALPLRAAEDLARGRVTRAWLVDTRNAASVRGMSPKTRRTVVDHHLRSAGEAPGDPEDDVQPVGATATLIVERLILAGGVPPPIEASLLLLAIHEDTGSLTYAGTTARDLRAAAWLLDVGADLGLLPTFLRHSLSDQGRALYLALADSVEDLAAAGHRVLLASARAAGFAEELSTLASQLLALLDPDALLVLVDLGPSIQFIGRSRSPDVDVGVLAEALGGGGHAHAAGATLRQGDLDAVRARLVATLPTAVRARLSVEAIMSRGQVHTIAADTEVAAALAFARRYGHEGYPVVEGDAVLGLVTRRDLDRAMHHNLAHAPVRQLIAGLGVAVAPDDSVETLQHRMTAHNLGQVPVVEGGRLIGIVTRTDLLRLWAARAGRESPGRAGVDLASALRPDEVEAIHQVAGVAFERGEPAYLVGGLPRDLLLGIPPGPDIDLVVEGEAVDLARAVAHRHGGVVRAHQRFGTAKWQKDGVVIDLVSARAEYYAAPSALPTVEGGSLQSDLQRRDFTINTLAIDLNPLRFGRVIDGFNGLADLRTGRVRVLHPLSFVEDPTRILRAARFEQRFGFAMETGTAALVPTAAPLLGRVSGERIRAELRQLFAEPDPASVLGRLEELGVLSAISSGLTAGRRLGRMLDALPAAWSLWSRTSAGARPPAAAELPARPAAEQGMALWLAELGEPGLAAAGRLRLPRPEIDRIRAIADLWSSLPALMDPGAAPSAVYHILKRYSQEELLLAWVGLIGTSSGSHLRRYASESAGVAAALTGADLALLGLPSGPLYGHILRAALDARLDGRVHSKAEELVLAQRLAAEWQVHAAGSA